jgi:hypothetical protein
VPDLYQGRWDGQLLYPGDFVICADEKPSIQARARIHPTLAPAPGSRGQQVEHSYERRGALTYLAALDIGTRGGRAPRVFGRSETKGGIAPFDRLVWQVMTRAPYASARRVFWIVDNGSAHRGQRSIDRLEGRWPSRSSGTSRAMTSPGSWTALPRRSPGFGLPMIASQALSPSGGRRR